MDGVLVIDKPAGMTSFDVVAIIRRRFSTKKVGHGGTLDPDATGVLVVGVGKATRLLGLGQRRPKRYRAVARFGIATSTQDASGEVLEEHDVTFDRAQLDAAMEMFVGDIEQIPPMVSAVKIGGERLYKKARRGETVERPARPVTIYNFDLIEFSPPTATFDIECSAGTYVRTLVHDLGAALGCGAHLSSLRRTEAGGFSENDAVPLDDATEEDLRPLSAAVSFLPMVEIDENAARFVSDGRALSDIDSDDDLIGVTHEGALLALYRRSGPLYKAETVVSG